MNRFLTIFLLSAAVLFALVFGGLWAVFWAISGGSMDVANRTAFPMTSVKIEIELSHKVKSTPVDDIPAGSEAELLIPTSGDSNLYLSYTLNGRAFRSDCGYYDAIGYHYALEVISESEPAKCEAGAERK